MPEKSLLHDIDESESNIGKFELICRLMALSKPEAHWIFIGCLASIVYGLGTPVFAVIIGELMNVFKLEASEAVEKSRLDSLTIFMERFFFNN